MAALRALTRVAARRRLLAVPAAATAAAAAAAYAFAHAEPLPQLPAALEDDCERDQQVQNCACTTWLWHAACSAVVAHDCKGGPSVNATLPRIESYARRVRDTHGLARRIFRARHRGWRAEGAGAAA